MATPETVLSDLRDAWDAALPGRLLGLYLHGSLIAGDFAADRSDLDLLAVLSVDPDEDLLDVLAGLHAGLDRRHPRWAGRIEVGTCHWTPCATPRGGAPVTTTSSPGSAPVSRCTCSRPPHTAS
ncbi:nucleotidyltransferase domain-containing protein [Micromonospora chersina]